MTKTFSISIVLVILCVLFAGCGGGGVQPGPYVPGDLTLLIGNSLGETLSVASRTNGIWSVQPDVLPTGQGTNDIVVDGNTAYIVNSLSNSIHVVNTQTMSTVREISTGAGTNPYDAVLVPDGTLWVTLTLTNQLIHVDPDAALPVILWLSLPPFDAFDDDDPDDENLPWPQRLCYANGKLYVAFSNLNTAYVAGGQGAVAIIDAATYDFDALLELQGRNTIATECPNPASGLVFFISAGDFSMTTFEYLNNGLVEVYDSNSGQIIDSVQLNGAPFEMVAGANGVGFLTNGAENTILRFDYNSLVAWPSFPVPDSGLGFNFVSGIAEIGDNDVAVIEFNGDALYIIDGVSGIVEETFTIGDGPDAIAVI
jgi:YVTN family beta-propeller protein